METGFVKVAAGSPRIAVADVRANAGAIEALIRRADEQGARLLVLPELCLTGYTCGDLFYSETLLRAAREELIRIAEFTPVSYTHLDVYKRQLEIKKVSPMLTEIHANLYCERASHKSIIIGKQGAMLGRIGSQARVDIERLLGTKVMLQLWVKVREGWRNRASDLRTLGYEDD